MRCVPCDDWQQAHKRWDSARQRIKLPGAFEELPHVAVGGRAAFVSQSSDRLTGMSQDQLDDVASLLLEESADSLRRDYPTVELEGSGRHPECRLETIFGDAPRGEDPVLSRIYRQYRRSTQQENVTADTAIRNVDHERSIRDLYADVLAEEDVVCLLGWRLFVEVLCFRYLHSVTSVQPYAQGKMPRSWRSDETPIYPAAVAA